ncbi:MAG TPA: glycosyltransferase family 4 protein [Patescibacteria group bacterium]|nr:glycosyltransferase family 4 protein [Patescibacteria group bacterium]
MNILWLTWKDRTHPSAGGAEVISHELRLRLTAEGHDVTLLTCGYTGALKSESVDGVTVIRVGNNRYLHPWQAAAYYIRYLRNKFDIVVEEVNGAPYFSVLFGKRSQRFLFYHHLEREVWLHEAKPPVSYAGYYVFEPLATHILGNAKVPLITVSESSRQEMARYGFPLDKISIISEGIEFKPLSDLARGRKYRRPTVLSLGGIRAMKRTLDQIKAFELAKQRMPNLQMKIAGDAGGAYGRAVLDYAAHSKYADDIAYLGRIPQADKPELMRRCHLITVTSVKEGWGLIVTEAASQGTPAVVYDVPGLRDSVRSGQTGLVTAPHPEAMADGITHMLEDQPLYERIRTSAWEWSKQINFAQSYHDFKTAVGLS